MLIQQDVSGAVCQQCGASVADGAAFCSSCGASLSTTAATAEADAERGWGPRAEPRERPVFSRECPRCGAINEPDGLVCLSCGLRLEDHASFGTLAQGLRPAGFWIRLGAVIIDAVLLTVAVLILRAVLSGDLSWLLFLVGFGYQTVMVAVYGATLGKRIVGIKVVRPDGAKVGFGRAFARSLGHIPSSLLLYAGYLMAAFRQDKRALHDLLCDTAVVHHRDSLDPVTPHRGGPSGGDSYGGRLRGI